MERLDGDVPKIVFVLPEYIGEWVIVLYQLRVVWANDVLTEMRSGQVCAFDKTVIAAVDVV